MSKVTLDMTSHTKNSNPKHPNFLVETRRFSESVEGLNSSLAQSAGELRHLAKTSKYCIPFVGFYFLPKICFLSNNFGIRNARKPIKGSEPDYSLVCKTKFEPKIGSFCWRQDPITSAKGM